MRSNNQSQRSAGSAILIVIPVPLPAPAELRRSAASRIRVEQMMQLDDDGHLMITTLRAEEIAAERKEEIVALCSDAYQENFDRLFELLPGSVHVLGHVAGRLLSHAAWVTRWLQPDGHPLLRTAFVEAVATRPHYRGGGFATAIMREVSTQIRDFDLGALSPSDVGFYERLGWELWRGPLAIRIDDGVLQTPDEHVMIFRLPGTPIIDTARRLTAEWRVGELW